jgi:Xaa-Pro aminopeptidase
VTPAAAGARFSLSERDRRWRTVAANAAQAGFDCILVPHCLDGRNLNLSLEQSFGARSDGRYLTQMEDAAVVLPSDGARPIVVNASGAPNDWVAEPRVASRGSWGGEIAQALRDAGMERARIGVSGLRRGRVSHSRAVDGVVVHSSYAEVRRQLPNATFEDATDVIGFARYVKSQEEIACLRQGAQIALAGIETMIELARPGMALAQLYAGVMERMLELGSAYYPLAMYAAPLGSRGPRFENPPPGRLQAGDLITHETDGLLPIHARGWLYG